MQLLWNQHDDFFLMLITFWLIFCMLQEWLVWCKGGLNYLVDDWGINKSFLFFHLLVKSFWGYQKKVCCCQFTKFCEEWNLLNCSWKPANKFERQQKGVFRMKTSRDYFNYYRWVGGVNEDNLRLRRLLSEN